jgi:hypothetical protein
MKNASEHFDNVVSKLIDGSALFEDGRVNIPAFGDAADYEMWLSVKDYAHQRFEPRGNGSAPPVYFIGPALDDLMLVKDEVLEQILAKRKTSKKTEIIRRNLRAK